MRGCFSRSPRSWSPRSAGRRIARRSGRGRPGAASRVHAAGAVDLPSPGEDRRPLGTCAAPTTHRDPSRGSHDRTRRAVRAVPERPRRRGDPVEPPGGSPSRGMAPLDGSHSLFWTFRNAGKLGVVLDLDGPADRERLHELLAHSDVVIDSAEPGTRGGSGLDAADLAERHPHLIVTSITAYGRTGPYAGRDVPDAVIEATGGMAFKAGTDEGGPILPPGLIGDDTASLTGAWAVLCALWQKEDTGAGQVIDLSVNEALAQITDWSLSNWSRAAGAGTPSSEKRAGPGPVYTIIPCADGYVRLVVLSPRQWHAIRAWLGEPDYLQDPDLDNFVGRLMISDAVLNPLYGELWAEMTMLDVCEEAQRRGIVCTPILKPAEVLTNPHLASRGTFDDVVLDDGRTMKLPSGWFEIDGERVGPTGPPPAVGEHTERVFADLGPARPAPEAPLDTAPPLAGLRVMDFGHGGVGVETGRMFGEYGADVIKIESRTYPDFIRVVLGGEMSPSFASSSRSKRSLGINAKTERGLALLRQMAHHSHVVIENNSTGTMIEMGLGYEVMKGENPDIVMMSSQLMGSRGTWSSWLGYGPNTQVTGGMTHLWSYEDDPEPAGSQSIFPDHFAGRSGAVGALAGLLGNRRLGDGGMHVAVCQVEQVVGVMGDLLAKESLVPGSVVPRGNHSDHGTPWGLFPTAGDDQWVAICVRSDAEWEALVGVMGSPAWADPSMGTADRRAAENDIEAKIAEWTAGLTSAEVTEACLAAGVPAGPMLTGATMSTDPHLEARGYLVRLDQPPIGGMIFEGGAFRATAMVGPNIFPAPGLGQHTRDIARDLFGLSADETEGLVAEGVLETDPPPTPAN
ncbi:MAG: CoA transferase [Acidimicrobiales bacterium]